jgi:hypothetical protein
MEAAMLHDAICAMHYQQARMVTRLDRGLGY